jgi:hypothetical protein
MRNIQSVIKEMINEIPKNEKNFIFSLERISNDSLYKAPEDNSSWMLVSQLLNSRILGSPTEWQFKILSIFTTKSIDELKSFF